eukprot:115914-Pelagomonas_calceolata.AAC.1
MGVLFAHWAPAELAARELSTPVVCCILITYNTWLLCNLSTHFLLLRLTELRIQFQQLFSSAPPSSASRLRDFVNQADVLELAKFVSACLKCYD